MAWLLCSRQDVTEIHPTDDSLLKDSWSDMVEGLIKDYLGEPNLGANVTVTDELYNGDGTHLLFVRKPPLVSVSSLTVETSVIPADEYTVTDTMIILKYEVFPKGHLNVKVSYVSGGTTIPQTVRLCAAAMIVAILNYRGRHGADSSIKWAGADQKAGENSPNLNVGLTSHLDQIMKRTLKRRTVRFW